MDEYHGQDIQIIDIENEIEDTEQENRSTGFDNDIDGTPVHVNDAGPIPSTPRIGYRKRRSNQDLKKMTDENGALKTKLMQSEMKSKDAKTEMFTEIKDYFKLKRQCLQQSINNNQEN